MDDNNRLSASLKAAKSIKAQAKKRAYFFDDPKNARKAQSLRPKRMKTDNTRIHIDALELAKHAWPNSAERIKMNSEAIREKARKALGI